MAKPTILAVDDAPAVLSAITRDRQRYYGSNYRILRANGGATALTALDELRRRNEPGGQAGSSSLIENYLGFPAGLSGGELARRAVTQANAADLAL